MRPGAVRVLATLNAAINSNVLLSGLLVAMIATIIGGVIGAIRRRHQPACRSSFPARNT